MRTEPKTGARQILASDLDVADNTAAAVTVAADTDEFWVVDRIDWSYDAAPTGGLLTIAYGTSPTTVWQVDITAAGPGFVNFDRGLHNAATKNEQLVVTLAAGGAGIGGELNVLYR